MIYGNNGESEFRIAQDCNCNTQNRIAILRIAILSLLLWLVKAIMRTFQTYFHLFFELDVLADFHCHLRPIARKSCKPVDSDHYELERKETK